MWLQKELQLAPRPRGFHLISGELQESLGELSRYRVGMLHLLLAHTSAGLTINENACADVRRDFRSFFDRIAPEDAPFWTHTDEGPDDMPAHIKTALLGSSLTLPLRDGEWVLGRWQGIYLCEHRDQGGPRRLIATAWGELTG